MDVETKCRFSAIISMAIVISLASVFFTPIAGFLVLLLVIFIYNTPSIDD